MDLVTAREFDNQIIATDAGRGTPAGMFPGRVLSLLPFFSFCDQCDIIVEVDAIATELFSLQMLSNSEFHTISFAKFLAHFEKEKCEQRRSEL